MEKVDRYLRSERPKYDCLIFDLDDTLYPYSSGIAEACGENIREYMVERLNIEESKVAELSAFLYKNYGTTMAGLRAIGYDFDYDEYHSFVHSRLPYEKLKQDLVLRNLLQSIPLRKIIFTNADRNHALTALEKLGLEGCFEGIICFETLNPTNRHTASNDGGKAEIAGIENFNLNKIYDIAALIDDSYQSSSMLPETPIVCKPSESCIRRALQIAQIDNPNRTLFFEDSIRNIQAGKRIGLDTVLVGKSQRVKGTDYALESIHNIREALPQLWDVKSEVVYSEIVGVQTPVIA